MITALLFGLFALALWVGSPAWAAQKAKIIHPVAGIYQTPDIHSAKITELPKDTDLTISSESLKGKDGEVWYKTRLITGSFGYVMARDLLTEDQRQFMRAAGIQVHLDQSVPPAHGHWSFVLRAMGVAGYRLTPTGLALYGGDFEFNYSFLPKAIGYQNRMLAFGPAFLLLRDSKVLLGSFIFRFYTPVRTEPEIRLRLGKNLTTGQAALGTNFGLRYPLSLSLAPHLEAYFEFGGLYSFESSKMPLSTFDTWGSLGLGLHF